MAPLFSSFRLRSPATRDYAGPGVNNYAEGPALWPAPPPGGGYLVLTKHQISNFNLVCAIRTIYPQTKIIVQQEIPIE